MDFDPYRLHNQGFEAEEIEKIRNTISVAEQKKQKHIKILEVLAYWVLLAFAIIGNILVSFTLIPYIVVLNTGNLYLIVIIIGISTGLMFSSVIKSLEIKLHHHALIIFSVPITAFISFFVITEMSNQAVQFYKIHPATSPAIIAIIYVASFMAPYAGFLFSKYLKNQKYHKTSEQV